MQLIAYANQHVHFLRGGGFADEWVNDKSHCWLFIYFFLSPPKLHSWAGWDARGEGWLGTEGLKSTKPFWLLKIFLASLIALVAGGPAFRREHLLQMWLPDNLLPQSLHFFCYLGMRQRAREEHASGGHQAVFSQAWGANGKDACVVKGWKGIKKQRNGEMYKSRSLEPSRCSKPSFLFFSVVS